MINIIDIDITVSTSTMDDIIDNYFYNEVSDTDYSWNYEDGYKLSNSKYDMRKINFEHNDGHIFTILAQNLDSQTVRLQPISVQGDFNGSFYYNRGDFGQDSLLQYVTDILIELSKKTKGDLVMINQNGIGVILKKGRDLSSRVKSLAIIDKDNNIYSKKGSELELDAQDEDYGYVPSYLLGTWLEENEQFKEKLQNLSKQEQFDLMGQFAIFQKRKSMISANQFKDIMIQIGSLVDTVGGFKDKSLNDIYQLFV